VRLTIVGDNSSPEISAYASDSVRVTGYVPDVDPFFERARVFVAPIRFGAGVKGKIGESLAYGLPVVTTPVGAEGMGLVDGTSAMIASDARAFADAVVRLYRDGELWQKLSDNGYAHVREHFSPEVVERVINEPLMRLGAQTAPQSRERTRPFVEEKLEP
jgi:glycosyltransferase involved in cell wall biosynthesis